MSGGDAPAASFAVRDADRRAAGAAPDGAAPDLARKLHARSGGNPYLSLELARGDPCGDLTDDLRAVLLARLRAAGPSAALVVATAGLLARPVTDAELVSAARGNGQAVRSSRDRGLLVAVPGAPGCWTAPHPVVAEVAYAELTQSERRRLHSDLAAALESTLAPEPSAARLAEVAENHLLAGNADDVLASAVRAAEAAAAQYAFAEAGRWYAAALAAWPAATVGTALVPTRSELAALAGRNLSVAGRHREVLTVLDPYLDRSPLAREAIPALRHRAWARFVLGDTSGALADVDCALSLLDEDDPADLSQTGHIYSVLSHILGTSSRWPDALHAAVKARELGTRAGSRRLEGRADTVIGVAALIDGQADAGLELLTSSLQTARALGEPDDLALAGVCVTDHYLTGARPARAVESAEAIRADLRRLSPEGHWLDDMLAANQAHALLAHGEWDRAVAVADEARPALGWVTLTLAEIDVRRGDVTTARRRLAEANALDRDDQPQFHLSVAIVRAALLLLEGRVAEALAVARRAVEVVRDTDQHVSAIPLLLTGLRAAALLRDGEQLEALVGAVPGALTGARSAAVRAQVEAERADVAGRPDPSAWLAAAAEWEAVEHPYETASARVRAAEALLARPGARGQAAAAWLPQLPPPTGWARCRWPGRRPSWPTRPGWSCRSPSRRLPRQLSDRWDSRSGRNRCSPWSWTAGPTGRSASVST